MYNALAANLSLNNNAQMKFHFLDHDTDLTGFNNSSQYYNHLKAIKTAIIYFLYKILHKHFVDTPETFLNTTKFHVFFPKAVSSSWWLRLLCALYTTQQHLLAVNLQNGRLSPQNVDL